MLVLVPGYRLRRRMQKHGGRWTVDGWTSTVDEDYESLEAEWMREYLVEIDAVGERESDAINQNLENKKEEGGHD